ncbi:DUF87 domain-containing protein [Hydrogenobacter sp. T-2]|uniref:helicase HerA domain-containing protein n=1 Tax=Pampinifervens diazotrophicum TaxID=1632018 RepID=UPI002B2594E9|nr:DUF87 domain-containing protein [Hydrogenobacter sp. T-2]WPM32731.1 DUF87 domain-containing protein [Hydrogenobacter sp. T-2]
MKNFLELIGEEVAKAKKSLKIASPWIDQCILEKTLERLPEGVKLEVILKVGDLKDLHITGGGTFRVLERYGAEIYINERLHAKIILIDDRIAFVGSANLTRAGLEEEGNLEVVIPVKGVELQKTLELFEDYKKESTRLFEEVVAVVMSSESSVEALVLLFDNLPEQSFLWAKSERGRLLCKLTRVYTQINLQDSIEGLSESKSWLVAYYRTLLKKSILVGKVKVLLELIEDEKGYFGTPISGLLPGDQLLPVKEEDEALRKVMKTNLSGYSMDLPVNVGKLVGKGVSVFVDLAKVSGMHMAVFGTTGSGKTTFVVRLVENIPRGTCKTLIFDLFGEYKQKLKIEEDRVHRVSLPYTLLPIWIEDIKDLFREYGLNLYERGEEEKAFFAQLRTSLKPDFKLSTYREKELGNILLDASKGGLRREVLEILQMVSKDMGQEALQNQPEVFRLLDDALNSSKDVIIIDLRDVVNPTTRLNLTGLVLKEILSLARSNPLRRLVVLEEAHNFAPERGATDVPTGRENLAIAMTKRIALEGRKFGVGLVAVSQRPANLSKYVLSQLNTQAIFRLITQNDINAVSQFFEYPSEDQLRLLPNLKPGHLFLSGIAMPFSMLIEIEL